MDRGLLKICQVHRDLRQPAHRKSRTLDVAQSSAREAHRLCHFLGNLNIRRVQEDVVGDEKLSRSHNRRAGRRMHPRLAKIRLARRIGRNLRPDTLELPAADVLQILPLWGGCRRFVQINWNLISLPDLRAHLPRHGHAIFDGHAFNRNERHHVGRPHPRMRSLMNIQINQLRGLAHTANRRLLDRFAFAHQRDHAAVVIVVHLAIQQIHAIHLHGFDDAVYLRLIAPFRKVGNAFH